MIKQRHRRIAVVVAVVLATFSLNTAPAEAHDPADRWSYHLQLLARAGSCGRTTNAVGDHVRLWQTILWVSGSLSVTSQIDGGFGSTTRTATIHWQNNHGLTADGCVGGNTWTQAQYMAHNTGHMLFLGQNTYCEGQAFCWTVQSWQYRDGFGSRVAYMDFSNFCGHRWLVNKPGGGQFYVYTHPASC